MNKIVTPTIVDELFPLSPKQLFPLKSEPYNIPYAEWTARWWQWVLSMPKKDNPLIDASGKNTTNNQGGPVWFLAGTLKGPAKRDCSVPAEKAILFPIINFEASVAEGDGTTEKELGALVKLEMDKISDMRVNGMKVQNPSQYRVRSPLFNVKLPPGNVLGLPAQSTQMMSEGYWLFLKPSKPGKYDLNSFGSCMAGKIKIGVSYHLTVEK